MRVLLIFMLSPVILLLLPAAALAQNPGLEAQRDTFRSLLSAAENGRLQAHPQTHASLAGYPLYDYLTAADLEWRLGNAASTALDARIAQFIDEHPRLPPAQSLRSAWTYSLARRDRWTKVMELTAGAGDTGLKCLNLRARIALNQTANLAAEAIDLWLVGVSQPDACDGVFAWMKAQDLLTQARILERARLAAANRNTSLASYLARKLDGAARDTVQRWVALLNSPVDLKFVPALDADVAVAAFKRLALQDVDAAAAQLDKLNQRLRLGPDAVYEMRRYLAVLYAQNHRPEALAWFERLDDSRLDDDARAWRIRAALLHARWALALDWINKLPPAQAAEETWRYWRARSLQELGREDQARRAFAALAAERSYHGYLAADRINTDYSFNSQPLAPDAELAARLRADPALARARELHAMRMHTAANREWGVLTQDLSPAALQQAALIAHQWGWHFQAIITLANSDYWDDLDIRYPLHYQDLVARYAKRNALDPAYVLAIIRTESLFMPDARSPANAVGLMQLLPATARQVAREIGAPRPDTDDLEQPERNLPLGTAYLREQLDRFDNNLALASAAYNAGPHRVSRWLGEIEHEVDADVWVENIPYTETRNYVQRAMSHMTVFQARLGRDVTRVTQRISPITPDSESSE